MVCKLLRQGGSVVRSVQNPAPVRSDTRCAFESLNLCSPNNPPSPCFHVKRVCQGFVTSRLRSSRFCYGRSLPLHDACSERFRPEPTEQQNRPNSPVSDVAGG